MAKGGLAAALRSWLAVRGQKLCRNNLWQRLVKYTIATTLTVIISLIPAVNTSLGPSVFLAPLTTVFGHPAQRLGAMVEALVLILAGTVLGVGWSTLGLYLSSLVYGVDVAAAYTVRALFLAVACLVHGFLRSQTPRLFVFVLFLLIVSVITLLGTATSVTSEAATELLYPIFAAAGILLLVNVLVFPEFSARFLGTVTIETLSQTAETLKAANKFFIRTNPRISALEEDHEHESNGRLSEPLTKSQSMSDRKKLAREHSSLRQDPLRGQRSGVSTEAFSQPDSLASLTESKSKLRSRLSSCKSAQQECSFELSYSVLPPRNLWATSSTAMTSLVQNTVAVISACESKFALMDDGELNLNEQSKLPLSKPGKGVRSLLNRFGKMPHAGSDDAPMKLRPGDKVDLVKPHRDIATGDVELLEVILAHIRASVIEFQKHVDVAVECIVQGLAFSYDVARLPSGSRASGRIALEDLDAEIQAFQRAMSAFEVASTAALEEAARMDESEKSQVRVDVLEDADK